MVWKILFGTMMIAIVAGGGADLAAAQYTTASEEMKITIDLELEAPSAYYDFDGKTLSWRDVAENDSHYMRVTVRDAAGGAVTGATVNAGVLSLKDKVIGTSITLHETWDRERKHYGANLQLDGKLTSGNVVLKLSPGKSRRLSKEDGDLFTKPVTVKFKDVDFSTVKRPETSALSNSDRETTKPAPIDWPKGRRPYIKPTPYPGAAN